MVPFPIHKIQRVVCGIAVLEETVRFGRIQRNKTVTAGGVVTADKLHRAAAKVAFSIEEYCRTIAGQNRQLPGMRWVAQG